MDEDKNNLTPGEISNELAKQRNHAASERTMMAWIRTALSLVGFGIGIYEVADKTGGAGTFRNSKLIGLAFVILGILSAIFAIRENKITHKKLMQPVFRYEDRTPLGIYIGYALIVIAAAAIVNIVYRIIS